MFELTFIYNGHCRLSLGNFWNIHDVVEGLKDHQWSYSAIMHPRFVKSIHGNTIRIDYGAKDCYYLITKKQTEETK